MFTPFPYRLLILFAIFLGGTTATNAQTAKINLFIDCNCDRSYLRQEINYVNHVRDQALADIQLFIYDIRMGNGGRSYTLSFEGKNEFKDIKQELIYKTSPNMTNDEIRRGLKDKLSLGLLAYLLKSDQADQIEFTISQEEQSAEQQSIIVEDDPWNNWIFEIRGEAELEKEASRSGVDMEFGFEGDHVTEDWRIRADLEFNHSESEFKSGDEEFISKRQRHYAFGSVVRSLSSHWSAGIFSGIQHNTYNNIDVSYSLRPAIEYNIFPYREVLRREVVIAYSAGFLQNNYIKSTIFGEKREALLNQSLEMQARFRQPWGDVFANLEVSSFLHDLSKNRIELFSRVSIRVFKGLSVSFSANLDLIRDQINLPAGEASIEDILLRQRQIATNFQFSTGIGVSYTFGSAFNNIINTRM